MEELGANDNIRKNGEADAPRINGVAQKFLADLTEERSRLEGEFPLINLVIDEAFERVYGTGRIPGSEFLADVNKQKPIKVIQKVYVPVKQYPKFNFIGKLLGPKGNSLRRLHEETQCKIYIKGRGSMRNNEKEEEMRQSEDPRYAHLHRNLYVEISTVAPPAEAHARVAYALAEIRKYLIPDKNDEVSQEQLRELMEIDPKTAQQYSRTVLDKYSTGSGSKFLNMIKRGLSGEYNEEEMEYPDEGNELQSRFLRGPGASVSSKASSSTKPPPPPSPPLPSPETPLPSPGSPLPSTSSTISSSGPSKTTPAGKERKNHFQEKLLEKFDNLSSDISEYIKRNDEIEKELVEIERKKVEVQEKASKDNEELKRAIISFLNK